MIIRNNTIFFHWLSILDKRFFMSLKAIILIKLVLKHTCFFIFKIIFLIYKFTLKYRSPSHYKKITHVYVILPPPLGIGDLIMLSPLLVYLKKSLGLEVTLFTNYTPLFLKQEINWLSFKEKESFNKKNSLIIAPSFTMRNVFYSHKAKYFLGYFFFPSVSSNLKCFRESVLSSKGYNTKLEHYFHRTKRIITYLEAIYKKPFKLTYPKLEASLKLSKSTRKKLCVVHSFPKPLKPYIVIAPYSNWIERQYGAYEEVIRSLFKKYRVLVIGSDNSLEVQFNKSLLSPFSQEKNCYNLTGKLNLNEVIYLMNECHLFLGNDSGPAHLAFLSAKKTIVIFGSVLAKTRLPLLKQYQNKINVFSKESECCFYPCYDGFQKPTCRQKKHKQLICLKAIEAKEILKACFSI